MADSKISFFSMNFSVTIVGALIGAVVLFFGRNSPALRETNYSMKTLGLSSPEVAHHFPTRLNRRASERSSMKIDPEKFNAFVNAAEAAKG